MEETLIRGRVAFPPRMGYTKSVKEFPAEKRKAMSNNIK